MFIQNIALNFFVLNIALKSKKKDNYNAFRLILNFKFFLIFIMMKGDENVSQKHNQALYVSKAKKVSIIYCLIEQNCSE